ncbi:MAG: hypothetical protein ACKO96_42005, partial [Flammeovirgaceae bacterium]
FYNLNMKSIILLTLLLCDFIISGPTCITDYTNKYELDSTLSSAAVVVANTASCNFPSSVDTQLYLGDPFTKSN